MPSFNTGFADWPPSGTLLGAVGWLAATTGWCLAPLLRVGSLLGRSECRPLGTATQ
jgi:hypothetical protein